MSKPTKPKAKKSPRNHLQTAVTEFAKKEEARDLRREHGALVGEVRRLTARIHEMADMYQPLTIIRYRKPSWERSDAVAMAVASDWHVEEEVKRADVHGLNEYNLDIARERSQRFFQNALRLTDIHARDSKITTILMPILGDFFSGWIHEELMAATLLPPGKAAHFWSQLFISGIQYILDNSPYVIEGDMIPGNHGRMTKQVHFSDPTGTSLETMAYHLVVAHFDGNPRVRLKVATQAMVYRTVFESFVLRQIHGYETKYGGGVGGLTIPLNKAIAQWDRGIKATLTTLGHYHQHFDGGHFLANSSMIGYNTYAQAIKASPEAPSQAFALIHARNGGEKVLTAKIWLDKAARK